MNTEETANAVCPRLRGGDRAAVAWMGTNRAGVAGH